jgi:hypothetical protein
MSLKMILAIGVISVGCFDLTGCASDRLSVVTQRDVAIAEAFEDSMRHALDKDCSNPVNYYERIICVKDSEFVESVEEVIYD